MRKKILLLLLALFAWIAPVDGVCTTAAYASLGKLYETLHATFPNRQAVEKRFGKGAEWSSKMLVSIHDDISKYKQETMKYPGVKIQLVYFRSEILLHRIDVQKRGLVPFLGIDIGSSKKDVIRRFGKPDRSEGALLMYGLEDDYLSISVLGITIKNNKVSRMLYEEMFDAK